MMKKVVKIVPNTFVNASRDLRELSVFNELGYMIHVIAKGELNEKTQKDFYILHRLTSRPLGKTPILLLLNRLVSFFIWTNYIKKMKADVLSCHDLICLFIGWSSTRGLKVKPKLIYDSHEFELGRGKNRSLFSSFCIKRLEGFLMKRASLNMMVNNIISDKVFQIHKLKERPLVVRNLPNYWNIDEYVCQRKRIELCEKYNIPLDSFIVMYHGAILKNRGIENAINSVLKNRSFFLIVLGNGEEVYMRKLKDLVSEMNGGDRVFFHPALGYSDLWSYVGAVDLGLCILLNSCMNHYYSLPNKLFENIQSLNPIIGSNFPEISNIINTYNVGLTCDPDNIDELTECIERLKDDKKLYEELRNNIYRAKKELCWEKEKEILRIAYSKI